MAVDTIVTPRALREIYFRPFQIIARDAKSGALMTAYNKVDGIYCSENKKLLQGIVRDEWTWDPLIISDWRVILSVVHKPTLRNLETSTYGHHQVRGLFRSTCARRWSRLRNAWQDTASRTKNRYGIVHAAA